MKRIIILIILPAFFMQLFAAPHARPSTRGKHVFHHRRHSPPCTLTKSICRIPWQTVAAGGAAVSGVIFAYKVADGIQQGTVEAARSSPEAFINKGANALNTVKTAILIGVACIVAIVGWRLARNRKPPA